jgi:hypothetical protein
MCITRAQAGIVLVVIGTVSLAFSVRIKRQYREGMEKVVDRLKTENPRLMEPTETYIVRELFWIGLICIAIGSLLQW